MVETQLPLVGHGPAKSIYLVAPCVATSTLVWSMGLSSTHAYCGGNSGDSQLFYMLPPYVFWIPLLRDWFLWSGAVAQTPENMMALLGSGHSVCFALKGGGGGDTEEGDVRAELPEDWLLEIAMREDIKLQIVTVQCEDERCCVKRLHIYFGTKVEASAYRAAGVAALTQALTAAIARNCLQSLGDKTIKAQ